MTTQAPRFLLKHVGNMGDLVFFIPPVLATLKRLHPNCHITFVTAWGFKDRHDRWGKRNQGGFSLNLLMTNPHIDQLVHWDDVRLSLEGAICLEEGQRFPTWNRAYFEEQRTRGGYDAVWELDFGIGHDDDPMQQLYTTLGLPNETYSDYRLYLSESDQAVAAAIMAQAPRPRIVLLEGLAGATTRGWDPDKVVQLEKRIAATYGVSPRWFGAGHVPEHEGRPLTLRENIATLALCDVGIGVLSGPLHFAAAVGLPTLTLYADMSLHRTAPAYFLNEYRDGLPLHRTVLGAHLDPPAMLKMTAQPSVLTAGEAAAQRWRSWVKPGRQATKSGLAVITVDEVMTVLQEMIRAENT